MTRSNHRKLQSLIRKHVAAQVALSWAGSKEVSERTQIEEQAKEAKCNLYSFMSLLITEITI